jgi:hypothetical protein
MFKKSITVVEGSWISVRKKEIAEKIETALNCKEINWNQIQLCKREFDALLLLEDQSGHKKNDFNTTWIISICALLTSLVLLLFSSFTIETGNISLVAQSEGIILKGFFSDRFEFNELQFNDYDLDLIRGAQVIKNPINSSEIGLSTQDLHFRNGASLSSLLVTGEAELILRVIDNFHINLSIKAEHIELKVSSGLDGLCIGKKYVRCNAFEQLTWETDLLIILGENGEFDVTLNLPEISVKNHQGLTRELFKTSRKFSFISFDQSNEPTGNERDVTFFLDYATIHYLDFGNEFLNRHQGQSVQITSAKGHLSIVLKGNKLVSKFIGQAVAVKSGAINSNESINLTPSLFFYLWKNKVIVLYVTAFLSVMGTIYPVLIFMIKRKVNNE